MFRNDNTLVLLAIPDTSSPAANKPPIMNTSIWSKTFIKNKLIIGKRIPMKKIIFAEI
jgi:hypothetical protein